MNTYKSLPCILWVLLLSLVGLGQIPTPSHAAEEKTFVLTDKMCEELSRAAREESRRLGVDISFAVADASGTLCYFQRQGNALPISVQLVPGKAYTAAKLRMPTEKLTREVEPGGSLFGINSVDRRIVVIAGGFPLMVNGRSVGAIGVGGGTAKEDSTIGRHVVSVFEAMVRR